MRRPTRPSQSADGQIDGEVVRDLARQTNEALKALLKRIEDLESHASSQPASPAVVINVGTGSNVEISPRDETTERIGFK